MTENSTDNDVQRSLRRLAQFFPEEIYTPAIVEEALEVGDIFCKSADILPYLQTVLMDEKILEVELDGMTRVYFSRLHDHPPPLQEREHEDGTITMEEPEGYSRGDYLKPMSHLIVLPLEPGIGNLFVRHSKRVMLRMFTTSYAVELGTTFHERAEVRDLPVLRLNYPVIGRIVRGAREFRAKVPASTELLVLLPGRRKQGTLRCRVYDVSASGMSFAITREQQGLFRPDEKRTIEIVHDDTMLLRLRGIIRHVSKVRGKKGTEFICGVQFDLATRAVAAKVESIVAMVQRAHLKELSELSEESGLSLII